ncbi:MAG: alanine--glyoxylate aminotransferase family protein [Anaerovoracaceae bacterium]|nr:alanine--glyoxylate aminotransferase family protein [Bacillota bacterium]MEE0517191.1 alanine--glyoxylate aminotransferase family protein [Anaerovoracaceae bacterium]
MVTKKMVMIPGPTPVVKSIQDQMGREIQAFGDPRFVADYRNLIADLGKLLNCSGKTFPLAGTGTLAMEMAIANTTKRGDSVLIISHGFFGDRFIDICRRKGLDTDVLASEWGTTVPLADIEMKLKEKKYAAITVSHVDTATGVRADIEEIGKLIDSVSPETVYIVDGVAATGGEFADVDSMKIDVLFTGSQKAFGVSPGMFVLWVGNKALARRKALGTIPEYYVDFEKWIPIMDEPSKYFATPAVNLIWAMKEATKIISEEGYKERYYRHKKNAEAMQTALESMGFRILAEREHRAVTLSNLIYPEGVEDSSFRSTLYEEGITVAGGLGEYAGRMFRLGHMGNIDINDEVAVLGVIERALIRCGADVEPGKAVGIYMTEMMK